MEKTYISLCSPNFQSEERGIAIFFSTRLGFADINECEQQNGMCLQTCINTKGSFVCTCTPGYQLGVDGRSCYREYTPWSCRKNRKLKDGSMSNFIGPRYSFELVCFGLSPPIILKNSGKKQNVFLLILD